MTGDRDKAKSFMSEFKETEVAKRLKDCDAEIFDSIDKFVEDSELSAGTDLDFIIWVDRLSHKLKSVQIDLTSKEDEEEVSISIAYDFEIGEANAIEVPSDARDFKEVFEDIKSSMQTLNAESSSEYDYEYEYEDYDYMDYSSPSQFQGV